jgi:hypothetical protein
MPKNKAKKESRKATLDGVRKEMAKPRVAKSAREEEVDLALKSKGRLLGCVDRRA